MAGFWDRMSSLPAPGGFVQLQPWGDDLVSSGTGNEKQHQQYSVYPDLCQGTTKLPGTPCWLRGNEVKESITSIRNSCKGMYT